MRVRAISTALSSRFDDPSKRAFSSIESERWKMSPSTRAVLFSLTRVAWIAPLTCPADGQFLRDHIALNVGALVDQNVQRPQLPLNLAEHIQGTLAGDFAYDRHAATDGGHLIG